MKRLFNIIILLSYSCILFAQSGLELGIFMPLGVSAGINRYKINITNEKNHADLQKQIDEKIKRKGAYSGAGFDAGVLFQIGYRFSINKDMSFSLLGEIGYMHDEIFINSSKSKDKLFAQSEGFMFESMSFGIYPKFNWKKISFGISAGVKVPLYARAATSYYEYDPPNASKDNNITRTVTGYNAFQIKNLFDTPVIPYLRFSADYSVYTDKKMSLVLGAYIGGDFPLILKVPTLDFTAAEINSMGKYVKQSMSSFDIGFQIGLRIMPLVK